MGPNRRRKSAIRFSFHVKPIGTTRDLFYLNKDGRVCYQL